MEPFKPANKEQVEARTIYVENLPSDADHESLTKVSLGTLFFLEALLLCLFLYLCPNF